MSSQRKVEQKVLCLQQQSWVRSTENLRSQSWVGMHSRFFFLSLPREVVRTTIRTREQPYPPFLTKSVCQETLVYVMERCNVLLKDFPDRIFLTQRSLSWWANYFCLLNCLVQVYFSDENVCLPSIVAAKGVVGASQTSESSFRDEISICIHVQGVWCKLFYFERLQFVQPCYLR